jgi:hypothetical protein
MTRRGRPPTDPARIRRGLELAESGVPMLEAAREAGVSKSALYAAAKAAASATTPTPGPVATEPATGAPAPARTLSTEADDLAIVDGEIDAVRTQLRQMRAEGKTHGIGALQKNLLDLIRRRRELRPPPPPDPDDEERRWRGDADSVISKIEAGVREAEQRRDALEGKAA